MKVYDIPVVLLLSGVVIWGVFRIGWIKGHERGVIDHAEGRAIYKVESTTRPIVEQK